MSALVEEREFLLRSIRDLDEQFAAGELDAEDYRSLRDRYTARAAEVLRLIEGPVNVAVTAPPLERAASRRPGWVPAAVGLAIVLVVGVVAGLLVARSSGERLPGDPASGSIVMSGTDRIARAQQLANRGEIVEALKLYDEVLDEDPENPVALAQRGWLVTRAASVNPQLVDDGLRYIERAIAADPDYPDAHFFRGMVLWRLKGDTAGAAESFQRVLDSRPPPQLAEITRELLAQLSADDAPARP